MRRLLKKTVRFWRSAAEDAAVCARLRRSMCGRSLTFRETLKIAWGYARSRSQRVTLALIVIAIAASSSVARELTRLDFDPMPEPQTSDYSSFRHENPNHSRLPCLLCHRRESNAATPTLPGSSGHAPCAGRHAPQFAQSAGPVCNIRHTDASGNLTPFPRLHTLTKRL